MHKAAGKFKDGQSRTSNEQFVRDAREHLRFAEGVEASSAVKDVRMALDLMLSQDGAVFASRPYSLTATHWRHTSSDPSGRGTGDFLAHVLAAHSRENSSEDDTVQALRRLLDRPDDTFRLTLPLLDDAEMGPPPTSQGENKALIERLTRPGAPLHAIQQATARLIEHIAGAEKTVALQRLVTLGSFGITLHLINATEDAIAGHRVPILLCQNPPRPSLREASRRTFTLARQRLTYAFEEELADELHRRGQDGLSPQAYNDLMRGWLIHAGMSEKKRQKAEDVYAEFQNTFSASYNGEGTLDAFVRAATPVCLAHIGSHRPASCVIRLSTHGGLLGPFRGGKKFKKYYRPAPQFLDMLVVSLLEPDEEAPASDFWERAWDGFGILCGARTGHDTDQLRSRGIRQVSAAHLKENAEALHDHLTRLGHARTYADGVTLIRADQ